MHATTSSPRGSCANDICPDNHAQSIFAAHGRWRLGANNAVEVGDNVALAFLATAHRSFASALSLIKSRFR